MNARLRAASACALAACAPSWAHACAVCLNGANDQSRQAFFDMTMLMTVLPLALFAAGLGWLAWKARHILAAEFQDRDELPKGAAEAGKPTA